MRFPINLNFKSNFHSWRKKRLSSTEKTSNVILFMIGTANYKEWKNGFPIQDIWYQKPSTWDISHFHFFRIVGSLLGNVYVDNSSSAHSDLPTWGDFFSWTALFLSLLTLDSRRIHIHVHPPPTPADGFDGIPQYHFNWFESFCIKPESHLDRWGGDWAVSWSTKDA